MALPFVGVAYAHSTCVREEIRILVTYNGVVTNKDGAPVQGATVSTNYESVNTNTLGQYSVNAWHDCPVDLVVSHPTYFQERFHSDNPLVDSQSPRNFVLAYVLVTRVVPGALNPDSAPSPQLQTDSTAPPASTRVSATLPSGEAITLVRDTTAQMPVGWFRWITTVPVSTASPEGEKFYQSCALKISDAAGTCGSPGTALISRVVSGSFIIDRTPPTVVATDPNANADRTDRRPPILIDFEPDLSGINASTTQLRLDGNLVTASFSSGRLSYVPGADLALGQHSFEVTGSDLAGNAMVAVVRHFAVVNLTTTTTNAGIADRLENISPTATQVTFANVNVDFDAYKATLSSNRSTGYGVLWRDVSLLGMQVEFANASGSQTHTIGGAPGIPSSARQEVTLGSLAATSGAATVSIPKRSVPIGNVSVTVPAAFRTPGTTATLRMAPIPVGALSANGDLFPTSYQGVVLLDAAGTTHTSYQGNEASMNVAVGSGFDVTLQVPGNPPRPVSVFVVGLVAEGEGVTFGVTPRVICGSDAERPHECVRDGDLRPVRSHLTIPGSGIALYGNRWTARSVNTSEYLTWHQVSANVADLSCGVDQTQTASVELRSVESSAKQLMLAADQKSTWYIKTFVSRQSSFGETDRDLRFGDLEANALDLDPNSGFNPDLDANYSGSKDEFGTTTGPLGARVAWSGTARNGTRMLASGTTFAPSSSSTETGGYNIELLEDDVYELAIDFDECAL